MGVTIHGLLERNARKYSKKEAFITANTRLTYEEMNNNSNQLARNLLHNGVKRGDRIAIMSRNNEHFFYAFFSLMKIGAIPMPLNIRLTASELHAILTNCKAIGVMYESELQETVSSIPLASQLDHLLLPIQELLNSAASFEKTNLNIPIDSRDVCEILLHLERQVFLKVYFLTMNACLRLQQLFLKHLTFPTTTKC